MARIVKKPEERRREIIAASRELFLSKDYERTTMQDVMEKVKIAKGTTYHYFKSKEELLEAVVQDLVDDYVKTVEKVLKKSHGNALDTMKALVAAGRVADSQPEFMENLHRPGNIGMHTRLLAVTLSRLAPLYAQVIQRGCKERLFKVEHPLECAEFMLAGIQFLTDVGCYPWKEKDLVRRQAAIPAFIEKQLSAPKGAFDFIISK